MYSKPKNLRLHAFFKKIHSNSTKATSFAAKYNLPPPKYKILLCQEQISQVQANLFSYFVPRTKSPIGHKLRQRTGLQDWTTAGPVVQNPRRSLTASPYYKPPCHLKGFLTGVCSGQRQLTLISFTSLAQGCKVAQGIHLDFSTSQLIA